MMSGAINSTFNNINTESMGSRVVEVIVMCLIIIVSVLGNLSLWIIVIRSKVLRTVTNMFILGLSGADLLVATVNMPVTVYAIIAGDWYLSDTSCEAIGFINMLTLSTSVLSLCNISINRYFMVVRPAHFKNIYSLKNSILMIAAVFTVSVLLSSPPLFGWSEYKYTPTHSFCFADWVNHMSYAFFMIGCCFGIPFSVMTVCNIFIFRTVRKSRRRVKITSSVTRVSGSSVIHSDSEPQSSVSNTKENSRETENNKKRFPLNKSGKLNSNIKHDHSTQRVGRELQEGRAVYRNDHGTQCKQNVTKCNKIHDVPPFSDFTPVVEIGNDGSIRHSSPIPTYDYISNNIHEHALRDHNTHPDIGIIKGAEYQTSSFVPQRERPQSETMIRPPQIKIENTLSSSVDILSVTSTDSSTPLCALTESMNRRRTPESKSYTYNNNNNNNINNKGSSEIRNTLGENNIYLHPSSARGSKFTGIMSNTSSCSLSNNDIELALAEPPKRVVSSSGISNKNIPDCPSANKSSVRNRRNEEIRLATTLAVVVLLFVLCWLPYCISMILSIFYKGNIPKEFHMFTLLIGYANSGCNPIIYGVMNTRFKRGFKRLFCFWKPRAVFFSSSSV